MARILSVFVALGLLAGVASAQDEPKVKIKKVPIKYTSPASGKDMFKEYCAACHGSDGKGDGPAVPALKSAPPDLTMLAARNGGKFSEAVVHNVIQGDTMSPAHGSKDMPVWGDLFSSLPSDESLTALRLRNLTKYIESIQQK